MSENWRIGKIVRLDVGIVGYGVILEEGLLGNKFPFTFDKIGGYRGESRKELRLFGIKNGAVIKFQLDGGERITLIRPLAFLEN